MVFPQFRVVIEVCFDDFFFKYVASVVGVATNFITVKYYLKHIFIFKCINHFPESNKNLLLDKFPTQAYQNDDWRYIYSDNGKCKFFIEDFGKSVEISKKR